MQRDSLGPSPGPSATPTLLEDARRSEVDVSQAEEQFNTFVRDLAEESKHERAESLKSHRGDNYGKEGVDLDVEGGLNGDEDSPFDLREYLSSSNDRNQAAGLMHKHVGVTWENLQVDVFGGINHKVKSFGFAFVLIRYLICCAGLYQDVWK